MKNMWILLLTLTFCISCKENIKPSGKDAQAQTEQVKTFKNVDVAEAKTMIAQHKDLIIIDVRTPGETADGMIEGAIEIDYNGDNFDAQIDDLDKSKQYLVYCKSGGRSAKASKLMIEKGFSDVTNMKGGYSAWSKK